MARGTRPRIEWGNGFANRLWFGTIADDTLNYPLPREGYEAYKATSGIEEAWSQGTDQFLDLVARWIPTADQVSPFFATGWDGPTGWAAFLTWARDKNPFRFFPDGRNLLENSSAETDAVGFATTGSATVARDAARGFDGAASVKVTTANVANSGMRFRTRSGGRIPIAAGLPYTLSAYIDGTSAVGKVLASYIDWYDAAAGFLGTTFLNAPALSAGWQRLIGSFTAPAGATTADPCILARTAQGVFDFWVDAGQLELGSVAGPYVSSEAYQLCYLTAPLTDKAGQLERGGRYRALPLTIRTTDDSPFTGY